MKKEHSSRWRKLDNAAQAFPAATGKKDTRVFRFYCQLKEDIQADLLQKALEETMVTTAEGQSFTCAIAVYSRLPEGIATAGNALFALPSATSSCSSTIFRHSRFGMNCLRSSGW